MRYLDPRVALATIVVFALIAETADGTPNGTQTTGAKAQASAPPSKPKAAAVLADDDDYYDEEGSEIGWDTPADAATTEVKATQPSAPLAKPSSTSQVKGSAIGQTATSNATLPKPAAPAAHTDDDDDYDEWGSEIGWDTPAEAAAFVVESSAPSAPAKPSTPQAPTKAAPVKGATTVQTAKPSLMKPTVPAASDDDDYDEWGSEVGWDTPAEAAAAVVKTNKPNLAAKTLPSKGTTPLAAHITPLQFMPRAMRQDLVFVSQAKTSYARTSAFTRPAPFPPRPTHARGGREIFESLAKVSLAEREEILLQEITSGNVPKHLRALVPIRVTIQEHDGKRSAGSLWVLPDYLAVGSDDDYVHVPLGLPATKRLAGMLGLSLPTVPLVNAIYEQATVRLIPQPLLPSERMGSVSYILEHEKLLNTQLAGQRLWQNQRPAILAGHKKDLVLCDALVTRSDRVAIFGWHRDIGRPIQPLSTVHDARYVDYSHGIRLVDPIPTINVNANSEQLLSSAREKLEPSYSSRFSKEGNAQLGQWLESALITHREAQLATASHPERAPAPSANTVQVGLLAFSTPRPKKLLSIMPARSRILPTSKAAA